jgi:hypothetical protein
MKAFVFVILNLLTWICFSGCSEDRERLAGSGSVTTNGLTAMVLKDGLPRHGVQVGLYPENYNPLADSALPLAWKLTSDHDGRILVKNLRAGEYNLIASDSSDGTIASHFKISISKSLDSVIVLPPLNLVPAGSIRINLPEFVHESNGFFYFPGTGIYKVLDSVAFTQETLTIVHIPPSTYSSLIYRPAVTAPDRNILSHSIIISPEELKICGPFTEWKSTYRVSINTTVTGANLSENLFGFPLLLRLNSTNFNFKDARNNGSDLRITKSDSLTILPFEIERWDALTEQAEIWVRLDTLLGNNNSRFFCLFSGNDRVIAHDPGTMVFDSASGFKGVWHLGDIPAGGHGVIRDQTINQYHGNPGIGFTVDALTLGIIGNGLTFDGFDDFLELPSSRLFLPDSNMSLTISAWIRPSAITETGDSIPNRLLSFKTDSAKVSSLAWGISNNQRMAHYSRIEDTVIQWTSTIVPDSSYYVALTYQGGKFSGFINGKLDFESTGWRLAAGGAPPVMIGGHQEKNRLFQGLIDEVRIEKIPRNVAWIKFCFINQAPGSSVVKVEP